MRNRLGLATLLAGTALLYLWDLGAEDWANTYYSGAVRAMSQNWTAFFFGSTDAGGTVTVDKPPAALWVMALSARIFGLSSWSVLVPQALMGVAAVALLHASVRRVAGPGAALLAGAAFALTPVAVLMFRYNNPDALLVLLLVAAAYATVRATERASTRWLVLAGALVGVAFLAKMLQAFVVLPALALAYLVAAPTGVWRRVRRLLAAGLAVVVAAGWWVALAELWPASSRPYIGGSETNSVLDLTFGYNGLGRIFGGGRGGPRPEPPPGEVPPGAVVVGPGDGFGGAAGWSRPFGEQVGGQVSWLLPAALVLLVACLVLTRRAARTDRLRASLLLWGGWTVVTAAVFSFAQGIFHPYYTVALAPGVAALVGIGATMLWRLRAAWPVRLTLVVTVAGTAAWAAVLLSRTPEFVPWLRWVVVAAGAVAALALVAEVWTRRAAVVAALAVVVAAAAGPAAYAADTITSTHRGGNPTAGPATGAEPGGVHIGPGRGPGAGPDGPGGGPGPASDPELVALLRGAGTTWSAATTSASAGAGLALASGTDVMGIGGFNGGDPAPTPERFRELVAAGEVRYFVDGGSGPRGDSEIATWVREHFTPTTVGGRTVYDLSRPAA
jgi:4-amino-4-deoxy-L-arabinose transferase-like glycosyltransferase